ncbi:MAG: GNAT family N-acetyltransferase [Reyranellaceae bacterium]
MLHTRLLQIEDRPALERHLTSTADTALLMLSNLALAGLDDDGLPHQGTYVGAFDGKELIGCLGHFWNGNVLVQSEVGISHMLGHVVSLGRRQVAGVLGPLAQVEESLAILRPRLGLPRVAEFELLFAVDREGLVLPDPLASGDVTCRRAHDGDRPLLRAWRQDALRDDGRLRESDEAAREKADAEIDTLLDAGRVWLAECGGETVSMATIIGLAGNRAMIGGVWTPEDHRNLGYARSVVAGALQALEREGVTRGVLFTGRANEAAKAAYKAIGFEQIGRYGRAHF